MRKPWEFVDFPEDFSAPDPFHLMIRLIPVPRGSAPVRFCRLLPILAILGCACNLKAADWETPQTFTAKAVVAILGPKDGLTLAKMSRRFKLLAQEIITSLLPAPKTRPCNNWALVRMTAFR